jgi:hypothetical protein
MSHVGVRHGDDDRPAGVRRIRRDQLICSACNKRSLQNTCPISVAIGAVCQIKPRQTLVDPRLEKLVRRAPVATLS